MTLADIKLSIFRQIDSFEKSDLEEVYGMIKNYLRGQRDIDDWNQLSEEQKKGIFEAIDALDEGKGTPHNQVMADIRME